MQNLVTRILGWNQGGLRSDQAPEKTPTAVEKKPSPLSSGPVGPVGPVKEDIWLQESMESEERFGVYHARLFPLLGQEVITPSGRGTLVQVFALRAAVSARGKILFIRPWYIRPIGTQPQIKQEA